MNRKRIVLGATALGLAVGLGYAVRAVASGIPSANALTYAGVLENSTGPVNASHNIQVIFYDAASGGTNLCQSTATAIIVTNGHFSVQLPDSCTSSVGSNPNVWVDVLVDGSDTGRTKIGAVPYAVEANHSVNADNAANATGTLATTITSLQGQVHAASAFRAWTTKGDGGLSPVAFDQVDFDVASEYNSATGAFKPKASGVYFLTCIVELSNAQAGAYAGVSIARNGTNLGTSELYPSAVENGLSTAYTSVVQLSAGDSVTCGVGFGGTGSLYPAFAGRNMFSGARLY